jgi:hypothetical protein
MNININDPMSLNQGPRKAQGDEPKRKVKMKDRGKRGKKK